MRPLSYAVAFRLLQRSSCLELIQNRKGVERTASDPKTKDRQGSGARDATIIGLLAPKFKTSQSELDDCGPERSERANGASGASERAERATERRERSERVKGASELTERTERARERSERVSGESGVRE